MSRTRQWRIQFRILTTGCKVDPAKRYCSLEQPVSTGSSRHFVSRYVSSHWCIKATGSFWQILYNGKKKSHNYTKVVCWMPRCCSHACHFKLDKEGKSLLPLPFPAHRSFAVVVSSSKSASVVSLLYSQYIQQPFLFCLSQKSSRSLYEWLRLILNHFSSWFWMWLQVHRTEQDTAWINMHVTTGFSNCCAEGHQGWDMLALWHRPMWRRAHFYVSFGFIHWV